MLLAAIQAMLITRPTMASSAVAILISRSDGNLLAPRTMIAAMGKSFRLAGWKHVLM